MFLKYFVVIFLWISSTSTLSDEVIVTLPKGQIKGKLTHSSVTNSTTEYYSFLGVRYAAPPLDQYRFQAPGELEPWTNVYDATYEKHKCYQVSIEHELQSEDCLQLNIFTPQLSLNESDTLLPVLFHIHGGGFIDCSGLLLDGFGPDFFMDYGVILVSINYRLGPFGFFSTGDSVIPGNAGLKDQQMALKWANENIRYFGGDPDKITIFGQSAGSASCSYHLLNQKSKGLFRAAILQSGSALTPWAYQRDQVTYTYDTAGLVNNTFNVTGTTSKELLEYLQNADGMAIHEASNVIFKAESNDNLQIQQGFYYAPVFEPESDDAFLTKSMYELYESGDFNQDVPVMMGATAEEAIYLDTDDFHLTQEAFDSNEKLCVPHDMHLADENKTIVGKLIENEYLGGSTWKNKLVGSIKYLSDQCFLRSIIKQAELQSKFSDVYFYIFSYHGSMGGSNFTYPGLANVSHGEELCYLFTGCYHHINSANLTDFPKEDLAVHYRLVMMWTNFAKYLNPTPVIDDLIQVSWPKVNLQKSTDFHYMNIGKELTVEVNPRWEQYKFWQDLYDKYAVRPYDTY